MEMPVILEQSEIICGLGALAETVTDLIDGASAIAPGPWFDVPVAVVPFPDARFRELDACAHRLLSAVDLSDVRPERTALIYCAAKGDISAVEQPAKACSTPAASPDLWAQAKAVEKTAGKQFGRTIAVSTACASGALGVEIAHELLTDGEIDHALLFGFDPLSRFVVSGFFALGALSRAGARPFDAARDGLTPGDGAAIALLSRRTAYAGDIVIAGAGSSNDANHRTGPSRDGSGLHAAARAALRNARMTPKEVGAVKCHGTGTLYNDAMEAKALTLLLDDRYPPCASFKGALGHTSGGGALLEIIIGAECLRRHTLPPTAGFEAAGIDEPLPICAHSRPIKQPAMLCLSAGFGGVNAAVVLREFA